MDRAALPARLAGPIAYPPTPFTDDRPGAPVDLDSFRRLIRRLLKHGVPAITPCGGTGECFSLSMDEWRAVTEAAVQEADGRALVLASVSGSIGRATAPFHHLGDLAYIELRTGNRATKPVTC